MSPTESAFNEATALVAQGAKLHFPSKRAPLALGAIAWIEGRGLLVAEFGAEHQGDVHLLPATQLESDGPGGVDVMNGEQLVGTIINLGVEPVVDRTAWNQKLKTADWRDFWESEIETAKEN